MLRRVFFGIIAGGIVFTTASIVSYGQRHPEFLRPPQAAVKSAPDAAIGHTHLSFTGGIPAS